MKPNIYLKIRFAGYEYPLLGFILVMSGLLAFLSLHRGHHWGDDFAAYISQAKALAIGEVGNYIIQNKFTIETSPQPPGPVTYPWGFPLILLPVFLTFGTNLLALKLPGIVFYLIFLIFFYFLARGLVHKHEALLLTSLFAFAPLFLVGSDEIMSDIPFLAVSTISLYLLRQPNNVRYQILSGVSIFGAVFIRSTGWLLLIPLIVEIFQSSRHDLKKFGAKLFVPLVPFFCLIIISWVFFPVTEVSYLRFFKIVSAQEYLSNLLYYLKLLGTFFSNHTWMEYINWILLLLSLITSHHFLQKGQFSLPLYSLATIILFVIFPGRQGLRYIYPILPYYILSIFLGVKILFQTVGINRLWLINLLVAFVTLMFFVNSVRSAYDNMRVNRILLDGPFDYYSTQMVDFINERTAETDIIIFVKPRILALLTGRTTFRTNQCADLARGDYVFLSLAYPEFKQIHPDLILHCDNVSLEQVFLNSRAVGYEIRK